MSSKFDEYLNKGGFTNEDRQAAQVQKAEEVDKSQSAGDLQNSYTPDPKDAGKQDRAGQEATVAQAGKTLKEQGVEAEQGKLSNYPTQTEQAQEQDKQQEKEQDNER